MSQTEDLDKGIVVFVQGSGKKPYELKNVSGVYSCSCPAWRNRGGPIDRRTCKHLQKVRGYAAEEKRLQEGELEKLWRGTTGGASALEVKAEVKAAEEEVAGEDGPALLLALYHEDEDPTGWWLSEKLNGVRAYWNGEKFISRLGNVFYAPAWFTEGFPPEPLDGELWLNRNRGSLPETVSIVRSMGAGDRWKGLRYLVFDAPGFPDDFEGRMDFLQAVVGKKTPYASIVEHQVCEGLAHLKAELARVEALGGEGLMLRQPHSTYEKGRSGTLLKVKSYHDAEGKVLAHKPDKGRHKGRLGALVVSLMNGETFDLGTGLSDHARNNPPPIGSIITYQYTDLTLKGKPLCTRYVGLRSELS